jgi:hypothetical protein
MNFAFSFRLGRSSQAHEGRPWSGVSGRIRGSAHATTNFEQLRELPSLCRALVRVRCLKAAAASALSITMKSLFSRLSPDAEKFAAPVRSNRPSIWDGLIWEGTS